METTQNKFFDSTKLFWAWIYLSVVVGNASLFGGAYLGWKTVTGHTAVMIGSVDNLEDGANFIPPKKNNR